MYILNRHVDWLLAGGLSILVYAIVYFLNIDLMGKYHVAEVAFFLAFIVNNPHFISSYFFFYKDDGASIRTSYTHFIVGIILPIALISLMLFGLVMQVPLIFSYIINALYFFVGYHYVRQVYGISLISLAKQKIYLSLYEKWALNLSMFPLWFVSFLNGHRSAFTGSFYSIPYASFALPSWLTSVNNILLVVSIIVWLYLVSKVYIVHNHVPLTLIAGLAGILLWHFPVFYDRGFFYLIPLFHSLQYMLIVTAVKKNQTLQDVPQHKRAFSVTMYIFIVVLVAYLAFHFVPEFLDKQSLYNTKVFGYSAILGIFLLFINLHHYAIDALLWRRGSKLAKYI